MPTNPWMNPLQYLTCGPCRILTISVFTSAWALFPRAVSTPSVSLSFPVPTCRCSIFLYCGHVVSTGDEMQPTEMIIDQFIMNLRRREDLDRVSQHDLRANKVSHNESSQYLQGFQERLRRKRYLKDADKDVRAVVVVCCRPPNLRCSRYMRSFGRPGTSQLL